MIEVPMPQDILKYKSKFIGNFSMRECGFLVVAGIVAVLGVMKIFSNLEGLAKVYATAIFVIPILVVGFVRPFDQPFEKIAFQLVYDNFIVPPKRYYEVHRPHYEKFRKGLVSVEEMNSTPEETKEASGKGKKQAKKKQQPASNAKKKIAKSKTYKAIR